MTTETGPAPFNEWITEQARGTVNDELTVALADVVRAVSEMGKDGSVTLKIKVAQAGTGSRTVTTTCKVTTAPPEPAGEPSIFFTDGEGGLHREDPYQGALDLRRVDLAAGEIRQLPVDDDS